MLRTEKGFTSCMIELRVPATHWAQSSLSTPTLPPETQAGGEDESMSFLRGPAPSQGGWLQGRPPAAHLPGGGRGRH